MKYGVLPQSPRSKGPARRMRSVPAHVWSRQRSARREEASERAGLPAVILALSSSIAYLGIAAGSGVGSLVLTLTHGSITLLCLVGQPSPLSHCSTTGWAHASRPFRLQRRGLSHLQRHLPWNAYHNLDSARNRYYMPIARGLNWPTKPLQQNV